MEESVKPDKHNKQKCTLMMYTSEFNRKMKSNMYFCPYI